MRIDSCKTILWSILALCTAFIPQGLISQQEGGGYAESWLQRNVGARATALAGVYTAIVNEPSGIFYNPAGAAFMPSNPTFNTSVSVLGMGRSYANISWAQEITESVGIGAGVSNFYSGSFTGRTVTGVPTRDLNNNQISAMVSAAYRFEFFSMGASVKYLNNSLNGANISASGFAFDLGTKVNVFDLLSFGLALNNLGGSMKWNTPSALEESIPFTLRTGIATEFGLNDETYVSRTSITGEEETVYVPPTKYVLVGLDAVMYQYDTSPSFILGAEAALHEMFALRGGISLYGDSNGEPQLFPMNYWGAGVSVRPPIEQLSFNMHFDYAVSNEYLLAGGVSHHITVIFEF